MHISLCARYEDVNDTCNNKIHDDFTGFHRGVDVLRNLAAPPNVVEDGRVWTAHRRPWFRHAADMSVSADANAGRRSQSLPKDKERSRTRVLSGVVSSSLFLFGSRRRRYPGKVSRPTIALRKVCAERKTLKRQTTL